MWPDQHGPYVKTRRMEQQYWLLDAAIRTIGVEWDQGRLRSSLKPCGLDARNDFSRVRERVKKFTDIHREFALAAQRREALAQTAEDLGHVVEAREHAFIASVLWGNAEWPLFGHTELTRTYADRKTACYNQYIENAPHRIRRIEIPFNDAALPGYLHLPRHGDAPFPCVVAIGGMDGFKEKRVAMYGDKYLERGIAQLVVEIPGQGEALSRGLVFTEDSTEEAGRAISTWIGQQSEISPDQVAIAGSSFGSFWATQIAATSKSFVGCGVSGVIHEPGMHSLIELASPTFKARFMYMSGYANEDDFDLFAERLDLRPCVNALTCPYLVVAGEDDELSPIHNTFGLLKSVPGPVSLVLFEGEKHSMGGGAASTLGPDRDHLMANWFGDLFGGAEMKDRYAYVDVRGQIHERTAIWRED